MKFHLPVFIIFAVFLADQISKWWVVEQIIKPLALSDRSDSSALPFVSWLLHAREQMPFAREEIFSFCNIVMVWNKGISFGMLNDHKSGPFLLTLLAVVIVAVFFLWMTRCPSNIARTAIALIIGGALGNVIDRLRFGAVADFLDFHVSGWHWPAFNVGDSTICIGIAILLVHSLFFETKIKQAASP